MKTCAGKRWLMRGFEMLMKVVRGGWMVGVMWFPLVACTDTVPTGTAIQGAHAVRAVLECICNCLGHDDKGDPVWLREQPGSDDIFGWVQGPGPDGTCSSSKGACSGYAPDGTFDPDGDIGPCIVNRP
jgi:hypothetical protein